LQAVLLATQTSENKRKIPFGFSAVKAWPDQ
jgi:hypothetical protein